MCKRRVYATAKSIYDIDINFFKKQNVKVLLIDLDNTLDSYKLYHPTQKAIDLIQKIREADIYPVIVSNNRGKRVSSYANDLGVEFISSAMKPFAHRINKFVKEHNFSKDEMFLIGDQMVTDVGAGNHAHIRVILTDKIVKEDQWTTRFNRIFGRQIRKHQAKKGMLVDWRNL